jgi:hypothetical protein
MRVAAQRVDAEAGIRAEGDEDSDSEADADEVTPTNLFLYSKRKTRADYVAGVEIHAKAVTRTRVRSCRKNVVTLVDGTSHPVYWLEQTVNSFRQAFLHDGDHFYKTQLLVQSLPPGTTNLHVRQALQQWRPSRVNSMRKGKYFYVVLSDQSECIAALLAAQAPQFSINGGSARSQQERGRGQASKT